jgi:hypothetical protein
MLNYFCAGLIFNKALTYGKVVNKEALVGLLVIV